jgi:hypothetical protein
MRNNVGVSVSQLRINGNFNKFNRNLILNLILHFNLWFAASGFHFIKIIN